MKLCRDCGEEKPLDQFFLTSAKKPMGHCKPCHRERTRRWRLANPDKVRQHSANSYAKLTEEQKERARAYHRTPEARARADAWRAANRERLAAYQREYRAGAYKWRKIERQYGITREQYEALVERQQERCAICLTPLADVNTHIDHCHETGRVRGILCGKCNQAIGLLQDRTENAARAAAYLAAS